MKVLISKLFTLSLLILSFSALGQKNGQSTVLEVGGEKISKAEFKTIYLKNNQDSAITKEALDDYIDLFINFKLKVREAERLGLDTSEKFKREFRRYRDQLAQPYLTDSSKRKELLMEAYQRSKQEVNAHHILVKVPKNAAPEDTAKAYKKIQKIRKNLKKSDKEFLELGRELAKKDKNIRASDLGYFSAFRMVYPFESAAYNTKEGGIAGPVRTQFGYHLIKVADKREARGRMKAAHIMVRAPRNAPARKKEQAKKKIDEVYSQLTERDVPFKKLAKKYSDDRRTARRGGELPWFTSGEMLPAFENAAFALDSNGMVSKPVRTRYGWHIIKRIAHEPIGTFEEMKPDLEKKLKNNSRRHKTQRSFINKLEKQYDPKIKRKVLKDLISSVEDSLFFSRNWKGKEVEDTSRIFLTLGSKELGKREVSLGRFVRFLRNTRKAHLKGREGVNAQEFIKEKKRKFIDEQLIQYEKDHLGEKYPEYSALLQEYRDGILLFELMEQMVWEKAVKDTMGLKEFYEKNKEKYEWEKRVDGSFFYCKNQEVAEKVKEMVQEGTHKNKVRAVINAESALNLKVDSGIYEISEKEVLKKIDLEKGFQGPVQHEDRTVLVEVNEVMEPRLKTLDEARGVVTSDYQDHLEDRWIEELREKYDFKVNKEILYSLAEENE